jgi:hypothetical protein
LTGLESSPLKSLLPLLLPQLEAGLKRLEKDGISAVASETTHLSSLGISRNIEKQKLCWFTKTRNLGSHLGSHRLPHVTISENLCPCGVFPIAGSFGGSCAKGNCHMPRTSHTYLNFLSNVSHVTCFQQTAKACFTKSPGAPLIPQRHSPAPPSSTSTNWEQKWNGNYQKLSGT